MVAIEESQKITTFIWTHLLEIVTIRTKFDLSVTIERIPKISRMQPLGT